MADSNGIELASVYVNLVPSLKGAPDAISKAVNGAASRKASSQLGTQMVDGITKALKSASGIPAALAGVSSKVASGFQSATKAVSETTKAVKATSQAFSETSKIARGAAAALGKTWQGTLTRLAPNTVNALGKVKAAASSGMSAVSGLMSKAGAGIASAWADHVTTPLSAGWAKVTAPAREAFASLSKMASSASANVQSGLSSAMSSLGTRLSNALEAPRSNLAEFSSKASAAVSSAFRYVGVNVSTTGTVVANAMSGIQRTWSSAWAKMPAGVQSAFSGLGSKVSSAVSGLGSVLGKGLASSVNVAATMGGKIGSALSGAIGVGVNAAGVAVAGLAGVIGANLGGAVQRADLLNNFPKVMENIGYSADDATAQINRISDSLDGLPTSTDAVVQTVKGLAPLTGSLSSATDVALSLNDALLAGGASTALTENALEQYRQMLSNGTVDMMAWRSLTSAMPGQMDQLAKSILGTTANTTDLYDAMKDGTVSFDDFNQALVDLDSNGANGLASFNEQATTATQGIGTAFTNAGNRVKKAIATVIGAIGVDSISDTINSMTSGITGFGDKVAGVITSLKSSSGGEGLGSLFAGLAPVIGGVVGALGPLMTKLPMIGGLFGGLTGPVGIVIGLFTSIMGQSDLLRNTLGTAFQTIAAAFTGSGIQGAMSSLSQSLSLVATQLGGALAVAVQALAPVIADIATSVLPVMATTIGMVATALAPIAGTIITTIANVLAAILPTLASLATSVLPVLGNLISTLAAALQPVIEQIAVVLVQAFTAFMPLVSQLVTALLPVIVQLVNALAPLITQVLGVLVEVVQAILPVLVQIIAALLPVLKQIITAVIPVLISLITAIITVLSNVIRVVAAILIPTIQAAAQLITIAVKAIGAIFTWLWTNAVSPVVQWITNKLNGLATWMSGTLVPAIRAPIQAVKDIFQSVKDKASSIADGITTAFSNMKDSVASAWNGIKSAAAKPVNFLIKTVYTGGIKSLVDGIVKAVGLKLTMPTIGTIPGYASGGVLPGYSPGRDIYHFMSPDGGGALALSGGEAIMRPEWVRAVGGPSAINAMNAAAAYGRPIPGGDTGMRHGAQAFAKGGIWDRVKDSVGGAVSSAASWIKDTADSVASIIEDPVGAVATLVRKPVDALTAKLPGSGNLATSVKAIPGQAVDAFASWLKGNADSATSGSASSLVSAARQAVRANVPYVWGGSSIPPGLDCSGLVYWAAHKMGSKIPRLTAAGYQSTAGGAASRNTPGNLLFWGNPAYHVAITSGGGKMVEEPHPGASAREVPIWGSPSVRSYKFDTGGFLQPGVTVVRNETGKPEPVFTAGQFERMTGDNTLMVNELVFKDADGDLIGRMRAEADARAVTAIKTAFPGQFAR